MTEVEAQLHKDLSEMEKKLNEARREHTKAGKPQKDGPKFSYLIMLYYWAFDDISKCKCLTVPSYTVFYEHNCRYNKH